LSTCRKGSFCAIVWLLSALLGSASATEENPYIRRSLPAKHLSAPPVIDGDISDSVWQEATVGDTFVDAMTNQPVKDQTRFWLGYDNTAIYIAAYCWDSQPDKLVMQETKRDSRLWNDDHFEINLDPFHTHNFNDFFTFTVNPRGTQASRMSGGRSGKTEWQGDWQAAARVVEDGWTLEMAIPWAILSYPNKSEPATLGFNARRGHGRLKLQSWFSNIGPAWFNEDAADWIGVELPAGGFKPELLFLPFLAAGTTETDNLWKQTARGGMDIRYRPTPTLTGVVALNPDFRNIQSEVEGIDFSRGERRVRESRPFFQEGEDLFQTRAGFGQYFYTRRIEKIDLGTKFYGKLGKRTNLGVLGTYDFADQHEHPWRAHRQDYVASLTQGAGEWGSFSATGVWKRSEMEQNAVLGYWARVRFQKYLNMNVRYGSSAWEGIEEELSKEFRRGDLGNFSINWYDGKFWFSPNFSFVSPKFQASNGLIEFPGRRGVSFSGGYWNEWRNSFIRMGGVELYGGYEERYQTGKGFEDVDGVLHRLVSTFGDRDADERFFRDNIEYHAGIETRTNFSFSQSGSFGHFREEDSPTADYDWSLGFELGRRTDDQRGNYGLRYDFGRADGTFRHFISPRILWKWSRFAVGFNGSLLRHQERRQQHILSINYDFTKTISIGGRIVFQRNEREKENHWNPYFSFRRSGETGIETFLIFGDPSGETFVPRLEGKVLLPL